MKTILVALAIALSTVFVPQAVGLASTSSTSAPYCGITWGSLTKDNQAMGGGEVDTYRTGQHTCYDRLVIDVDGPPAGYHVGYVSQVTADGSGFVVPTPGGAKLQVIVRHPSYAPTPVGQSLSNVSGYRTFRSVRYAGSFEGQTTIGLGVRSRLPFRVFTIPGGHGRIVVDVAHKW